jgi:hypothetical protein
MDRAYHNKATHKISYFSHAPVITYELNNILHFLIFLEKVKENFL